MKKVLRIAILVSYWDFWEKSTSYANFRQDRIALGDEVNESLTNAGLEVCYIELVDSEQKGMAVSKQVLANKVDAIVIVQSMCAPPTYILAALEQVKELPLVIWAVQRSNLLDCEFNAAHITANGATVGTPMLTNVLSRENRKFQLEAGVITNPEHVNKFTQSVRAAAIATRLRSARIGKVGQPIDGYACVDAETEAIEAAIGTKFVEIKPEEFQNQYLEADIKDVLEVEQYTQSQFSQNTEDGLGLLASLKSVVALRNLDTKYRLDAGTMNCHVPEIRYAEEPGVAPCFALGCETSRGIPWVCSGDVITAVAMLVAKQVTGAAFYHEIEGFDANTGELALANSGEHDLCWCKKNDIPQLQDNPWYINDKKTGTSAKFELEPGPATLVAFTPNGKEPSGFRFVVAQGYITDRTLPCNPSVGGAFKFNNDDVISTWSQWATAGVNHHSALAKGHINNSVEIISKFLNVGCIKVC